MTEEQERLMIRIHAMLYEVLSILVTICSLAMAAGIGFGVAREYGNFLGGVAGFVAVMVLGYYGNKHLERYH